MIVCPNGHVYDQDVRENLGSESWPVHADKLNLKRRQNVAALSA